MGRHRRRLPRPFCQVVALLLFSAQILLRAQAPDSLAPSRVYAVKELPVVRAAEEVHLQEAVSPPLQVADVLRRFTGVQVKDYGGLGGLKTVNIRSLGSEHVGIFLDGIQVDNAQNMQVDLGRFSTEGLSTVALFNGQKTRRLQTAKEYASGAAVHLESGRPTRNGGRVRLRAGSYGTLSPSLRWDLLMGRVALRAGAEFLRSDGQYPFPCFDTTLFRENADIRSLRLETQLFGRHRGGDWQLRLYSYGSERGFPGPVIRRALGFPFSAERQADQDLLVQGGWNQDWSARYSTSFKAKYANNYTHYNSHPEKNPMAMPWDLKYRQQSAYVSLAQSVVFCSPWSADLSTDLQYNALESNAGQFVRPRRTAFTAALATRVVWEKFRAAAHLVYQGTWDRYKAPKAGGWSRENGFRDAWMPSLSLFYAPFPWLEADAYVKRSYRLPSFNDLYYAQIGNSALKPESAFQAGADIRSEGSVAGWSWEVRVSPYYNRVQEKIVAIPTASQFRWSMQNIGVADILGLEVKAGGGYRAGDWSAWLTLRYTFQQALDHTNPQSLTWGNQLPYIPLHSGGVDVLLGWRQLSFSWNTSFTGERWSLSANISDYWLEPWSLSDAALSWHWDFRLHKRLEVSARCNNVLNKHYQIVQGYPMPGINGMLSVAFSW